MVLVVVACVNMVLFCVFAGEALIQQQQQQQQHHLTAAAAAPPDIRDALFQTAAMAKKFQLVDTFERRTPTTPTETNWNVKRRHQSHLSAQYCLNTETLGVDTRQWLQTWSSLMN